MGSPGLTRTHTYVELEISPEAWAEIAVKLRDAGYVGQPWMDGERLRLPGVELVPPEDCSLRDLIEMVKAKAKEEG